MDDWDRTQPWYHGSDQRLTRLRSGSSLTQNRDLARVFSHRPTLVGQNDDGRIQHDGRRAGFLYLVAEPLRPEDIYPHPHPVNASRWEWLTTREVAVQLLEVTQVRGEELFSDAEIARIRRQQQERGQASFIAEDERLS